MQCPRIALVMGQILLLVVVAGAQTYVGSDACQVCHGGKYNTWVEMGHHYKLNAVTGAQAPTYPFEYNAGTPNVVDPPYASGSQLGWDDISYVIGGYYWKARFMDLDGYIVTGDAGDVTQWNVWTQGWVAYQAGQVNYPYDCGRCHTTGYSDQGQQGGLPGIVGTWNEEGVGCEACHGPGGDHIASPSSSNIVVDESSELCGQCHYRNSAHLIAASGGWIKHHEQYDELLHSPHYDAMTCITCHSPHKSTVYEQGGLRSSPTCTTCHPGHVIEGKEDLECWDCHMPYSAKSATTQNAYKADVHSHQFNIWVTTFPRDSMFYSDETGTFVKLDENGEVYGNTLDLVCLSCHTTWTIEDVYDIAEDIHTEGLGVEQLASGTMPTGYALSQNFPNPFNPTTAIGFEVPRDGAVSLSVHDLGGRLVAELYSGDISRGAYQFTFNGEGLSSGIYVYRLTTSAGEFTRKMLLVR